jgi:hypothetical protein
MKKALLWHTLAALCLLAAGCGSEQLSNQEAHQLLQQKYPRVIDLLIYAGDAKYALQLQDAGLDTDGYVTTKKKKKLGDSTGWVSFTEKASPYLLETPAADKKNLIQKVKAGEEHLAEIASVKQADDGKSAIVSYTTKISTTPFGRLIKLSDGAVKQRTAQLIRYNDAWHFKEKGTP